MNPAADASGCRILQSRGAALQPRHFDLDYWAGRDGTAEVVSGGRGGSLKISLDGRPALLRRYLRGGLAASLTTDRYLWLGQELSRPWREWRILERAREAGLPVPEPVGACTCRRGLVYVAAIITGWIDGSETLASKLAGSPLSHRDWFRLGALLKKMQANGIRHADLNATNILLDRRGNFYLIDFDKARVMNRLDDWQWRPLYRLQRSLEKFVRQARIHYDGDAWQALIDGYEA